MRPYNLTDGALQKSANTFHSRRQTEIKMFWESVWNCQCNGLTFSVWSAAGSKL